MVLSFLPDRCFETLPSVGASVRRGGIEASSFLLAHQLLGPCRDLRSLRSPQMQTVLMPVHRRAFFRVILDHDIFPVPEYILDETPLTPVRATVRQGHGHMLPTLAVAGNDSEGERLVG